MLYHPPSTHTSIDITDTRQRASFEHSISDNQDHLRKTSSILKEEKLWRGCYSRNNHIIIPGWSRLLWKTLHLRLVHLNTLLQYISQPQRCLQEPQTSLLSGTRHGYPHKYTLPPLHHEQMLDFNNSSAISSRDVPSGLLTRSSSHFAFWMDLFLASARLWARVRPAFLQQQSCSLRLLPFPLSTCSLADSVDSLWQSLRMQTFHPPAPDRRGVRPSPRCCTSGVSTL